MFVSEYDVFVGWGCLECLEKAFAKLGGRSWVRWWVVLTMSEMRGRF